MVRDENDLNKPLLDIFPASWKDSIGGCENLEFRNIEHFKYTVSRLTQKKDDNCGVSYKEALDDLLKGKCPVKIDRIATIKNLVKSNLFKRGLITEEVYEDFKYAESGTQVGVDVAKYAAGDPSCVMVPAKQYISYFYELYISISYSCRVSNEDIMENVVKLLATIEELEKQKIFIKIVLVLPVSRIDYTNNFFISIPVFSHNELKTAETMCSVINDRLLRKFCFALFEDIYGDKLASNYGNTTDLDGVMNLGKKFDEIEFFNMIKTAVGE